jgi:Ca2+-binding RTX toxin-like protein
MQRGVLMLVVMALVLVVASGLALAVEKTGDGGNNTIRGTKGTDTLSGGGGNDDIFGKGRRDRLYGDSGADKVFGNTGPDYLFTGMGPRDRVYGDGGNDFLNTIDERTDSVIDCGAGLFDEAYVDFFEVDNVAANCESIAGVVILSGAQGDCVALLARAASGGEARAISGSAGGCPARIFRVSP